VRREAFEAADMEPREDDEGVSRLQPEEDRRGEVPSEVGFAGGEGLLHVVGPRFLEVVHLGKPFASQQGFGHILGGLTDARNLDQPNPPRLGRWLRGDRPGVQAEQPCRSGQRQPAQKFSPTPRCPVGGTHRNLLSLTAIVRERSVGASVEGLSGGVKHRARGRTPAAPTRSASIRSGVKAELKIQSHGTELKP
jgi:hypothetical protein